MVISPSQYRFIIDCSEYAERAHRGQYRKGGDSPYIVHPARVASLYMMSEKPFCEAICVSWLHDVIEDCCSDILFSCYTIKNNRDNLNHFLENNMSQNGHWTLKMIEHLTCDSSKDFKEKDSIKTAYYERLRDNADPAVCIIKFCDRIDNLSTVDKFSPPGREWYLKDTEKMFDIVGKKVERNSEIIYDMFVKTFNETKERFKK